MPELTVCPILETRDLDARYGDFQALFGVSMRLERNEVLAIIGANGAGKTTLMRSITGLLTNQAGMVRYKGKDIGDHRPDLIAMMGIAMVPEGRQLFASLSVEENLKIGAQSGRPGPWNLGTVCELFPILAERRHSPSTALSGGQQQMVAIGRALMANPELILFDEISLGLAPIVIKSIYEALPGIVGEGMAAIIVEQDIDRALAVADRVYCLQEGRVALEQDTATVTREEIGHAYFGM